MTRDEKVARRLRIADDMANEIEAHLCGAASHDGLNRVLVEWRTAKPVAEPKPETATPEPLPNPYADLEALYAGST